MAIIDPKLKEKIPSVLRNKFLWLFVVYFIYLLFINQNSLISQMKLSLRLRDLDKEETYYREEIKKVDKEMKELFSGVDEMEKFAREHYWMKRDSEDVYIFIEEDK